MTYSCYIVEKVFVDQLDNIVFLHQLAVDASKWMLTAMHAM